MSHPAISRLFASNPAAIRELQKEVSQEIAAQVESEQGLDEYFNLAAFSPMKRMDQFKELHQLRTQYAKGKERTEEELAPATVEAIEEIANFFHEKNDELSKRMLLLLREQIQEQDTPEEILEKSAKLYPDVSLQDEALDFLIATSSPKTAIPIGHAKEILNQRSGREIRAGRNMNEWARTFSKEGLGSPTALRDLYRDITSTPRHPLDVFHKLTQQFRYLQLQPSITFLLHSLGADLRAKGASIARDELQRLIESVKSLQGILGIFNFFQSKIPLLHKMFANANLPWPEKLDFELLSKIFVAILSDKALTQQKILQTAKLMGIEKNPTAQSILFALMRDALRQISPRYFRHKTHLDDLLRIYLAVIEYLEEEEEEEES
ncbi:MAG: hypothetical protein KGI80_01495 [Verrucomicrobiota bacterium]|nr:hypothetical protein [Verrucomicrobiota bacterium]